MAIDYKKVDKHLYMPKTDPEIIEVPKMTFICIDGKGNPNSEDGEYKQALSVLYALSYAIKMSKKGSYTIPNYFDYVVAPLEGYWTIAGGNAFDKQHKEDFIFTAFIRQPEFVTPEVFDWACKEVSAKKHISTDKAKLKIIEEGLCVQCMHIGSYDTEPETIERMHTYIKNKGYEVDFSADRRHHEIYLGDPRKTAPEKLKTVLRLPIKRIEK